MTEQEWLARVTEHLHELRSLVAKYHPGSVGYSPDEMCITASEAEAACVEIRKGAERDGDGLILFDQAVHAGDVGLVYGVLQAAWFGVPESTQCWQIEGFHEAVDLLEDPPDEVP